MREQVYTLHDGDAVYLPPDYRPIVLRLRRTATSARAEAGAHALPTEANIAAVASGSSARKEDAGSGEERVPRGGLMQLLPDYRPLTMRWQSSAASDDVDLSGEGTGPSDGVSVGDRTKLPMAADGRWIRRKRKSNEVQVEGGGETSSDAHAKEGEELRSSGGSESENAVRKKRRTIKDDEDEDESRTQEESLSVLRSMFEALREAELRKVLRDNGGDVNQAIDSLLTLTAIRNGEAGSLSMDDIIETTGADSPTSTHSKDDDDGREFNESEERIIEDLKGALIAFTDPAAISHKVFHNRRHR